MNDLLFSGRMSAQLSRPGKNLLVGGNQFCIKPPSRGYNKSIRRIGMKIR